MATGAGKDSNINIEGSDISGKQGTTLIAGNQVNIEAAPISQVALMRGLLLKLAVVLPQVLQ